MATSIIQSSLPMGFAYPRRSEQGRTEQGESWREFLGQHLIGGAYPMADLILDRFARDERLGLVFANDRILWIGTATKKLLPTLRAAWV